MSALAPPHLHHNLNRLVTVALQELAARQKAREDEAAMAEMARDPAIQAECASIAVSSRRQCSGPSPFDLA